MVRPVLSPFLLLTAASDHVDLPEFVQTADFKKYFAQYGKVVSAEVMFNRETNKSRGFGFVIFESESSVDLVLQELNHVIDGKSVC